MLNLGVTQGAARWRARDIGNAKRGVGNGNIQKASWPFLKLPKYTWINKSKCFTGTSTEEERLAMEQRSTEEEAGVWSDLDEEDLENLDFEANLPPPPPLPPHGHVRYVKKKLNITIMLPHHIHTNCVNILGILSWVFPWTSKSQVYQLFDSSSKVSTEISS